MREIAFTYFINGKSLSSKKPLHTSRMKGFQRYIKDISKISFRRYFSVSEKIQRYEELASLATVNTFWSLADHFTDHMLIADIRPGLKMSKKLEKE